MFAVISCLQQHDLRLVGWAATICVVAVISGLSAFRRAQVTRRAHRLAWIAISALILGSGVWATHFMAMLAYHEQLRIGFGLDLTLLSMLAAVCGMGTGVAIACFRPSAAGRLAGGAVCGGAVALMHFVGVAGMRLPATIVWDQTLVLVAIAIAVCGSSAAFLVAGDITRLPRALAAAALTVVAICGLHFTAMAAVTLLPAPSPVDFGLLGRPALAIGVLALAGLITATGAALLGMDEFNAHASLAGLREALNCAPSAMALYDRDGALAVWNEAYAEIRRDYGVPARRGLSFETVMARAAEKGLPESLTRLGDAENRNHLPGNFEQFEAPNGRWFQPRLGPTRDGGFVIMLNDITDHLQLTRREMEARRAAEAANAAKSTFLANMSHEIRTPLNGVLGMVQVMRRHKLPPEQQQQLEVIADAGRALHSVLDSVLDIAKIESGKIELEVHPFDLEETLHLATAAYAPLAAQKEIAFSQEVDPDALGVWRGDGARLRQVLSNLLSNALKFTSTGSVTLRVGATHVGLRFEVIDTGLGVPDEKQALIFEPFSQADASTTRRFGGTGLGLAICQEFVKLMGGELKLASQVDVGSTFSFELPMVRGQFTADHHAKSSSEPILGGDTALRILAAEDNPTNQLILRALLEPFNIDLTVVDDGREAVEAWACGCFDLILMDAQMPVVNGIDATLEIRERERAAARPRTPIIALSANVMRSQIDDYLTAGMDDFVAKPIELGALASAIERALTQAQEHAPLLADRA